MAELEKIEMTPEAILLGVDNLIADIDDLRKGVEGDTQNKSMPAWAIRLHRELNRIRVVVKDSGSIEGQKTATVSPRMGRMRPQARKAPQPGANGSIGLYDLYSLSLQQLKALNASRKLNVSVDGSLPASDMKVAYVKEIAGKLELSKEFETVEYLKTRSPKRVNAIANALELEIPADYRNKTERSIYISTKADLKKVTTADKKLGSD